MNLEMTISAQISVKDFGTSPLIMKLPPTGMTLIALLLFPLGAMKTSP